MRFVQAVARRRSALCALQAARCGAQGIWLCEHRDSGGGRRLVVTLQGTGK